MKFIKKFLKFLHDQREKTGPWDSGLPVENILPQTPLPYEPMMYRFEVRASLKVIPAFKDMIDFVNKELDDLGAHTNIDYTSIIALPEIRTDRPLSGPEIEFSIKFIQEVFSKSFKAVEVKLIQKRHQDVGEPNEAKSAS